ncbi:MAG: TlpA family protein disulfide reductase [Sulfuriferula sp.]|nr:TlpA family protein disulfide reductase [Sulfuriferula sp.]
MLKRVFIILMLSLMTTSAWAFSFTDTKGQTQSLDAYKGKWVLINFWATWCPPCLEEIPDLISLHDKYSKTKLVVIGVAMDYRDPKQVIDFADSMFISYPIVLGTPKIAAQVGPVQGLPTTYLFNPEGKIVAYQVGALTKAAVEKYINGTKPAKK